MNSQREQWLQEEKLAALKDWMKLYGQDVIQYAYSYVKDYHQAEDIAQDVFLKALTQYDTFRQESSPKTWLMAITANRCKDYIRSWKVKHEEINEQPIQTFSTSENVEREVIERLEKDEIWQMIQRIPLKYREVLVLFYQQERSGQEIAQILQISEASVRTRLHRARSFMKTELEKGGFTDAT
ncbi:sigma-70 family RNA polymerase sigma factor [Alicyclobacillus tolerans]|uniref:RNA polymerase sigma factor n=1 Tax=Alicyclobacillus tolerans TaxID=90970 RepID=A0ABT9LTI7_9BACL|nr:MULTISPECIES: sigma-70 family RNA polymerase sigma factor [Alicyclobacillus]MDP9727584.1 RNA polymerase sigma-70 factor (ECF subfamily) [Alicyclobacillus tengchongensis]